MTERTRDMSGSAAHGRRLSRVRAMVRRSPTRGGTGDSVSGSPIKIGLLYSLTGGLSLTETSIHKGAILAVEQVNAAGGVAGRPLVAVTADYASDFTAAPVQAARLLEEERVVACVGGYTSATRVAVLPVVRDADSVLVYPTYYEGLEEDEHVFYAGALPNQFLFDYIRWVCANLGERIYMIGSDYIYPRTLGAMIRHLVAGAGAELVADRYVPLGAEDFRHVMEEIDATRPDVILSNVVGSDSVPAFYRQFHSAGHSAESLPIASTVTTEAELRAMGPALGAGHFMTAAYFGSLRTPANDRYRRAFRARFGQSEVTHVAQIGAYNAVWLLALAAKRAPEVTGRGLRTALVGTRFDGNPSGWPLEVYPNHHTGHPAYIGRARRDGQFEILEEFGPREPDPYPALIVPAERRPRRRVSEQEPSAARDA